jgi:beta-lactamase regulating signal transducer with metallopeptidase domain
MFPAEIFSQPPSIFSQPASQAVTLALVHFIWQGALIAALLVAVVELLRIRRPQARYACSLVALLLMAACPLGTVAWQGIRSQESGVGSQADDNGPTTEEIAETTTHYSPLTTHTVLSSAQPYLLAAWLAGVGFFGCRLLGGLVGLRRLRRGALPLVGELGHRVDRLGERLGMKARSLVRLSTRVSEAMAVGLLRPIVLIPAAWVTEMPPAMLEAVIAHELAHLRRQDLWINLLQRVVETLLFYHPAVWWLSRRLRAERELCCDELAVAATGRRLEYVQALEHVARQQVALVEPLLAAGIRGERNMRLLQRVRNVLGLSAASDRSLWPAGLLALALPLGAWAYTSGLISGDAAVVVADDDKDDDDDKDNDKDEAKEEREEKEVRKDADREKERDDDEEREVRKEKDREEGRKEGDKERDNPETAARKRERIEQLKFLGREEEARRDGDRPVKEGARDGEKPVKEGARDGDRPAKKVIARDGEERVVEGTVRRIVRKDGDREEVVIEEIRGKKEAVEDMAARMNELLSMVKRLSMENERLKAELAEIRGNKEREGFYRVREKEAAAVEKEFAIKEKEGAAREKEAAIKAKEGAAREKEAAAKEREGAIREKEAAARRAVAEKQEAIARERKEGAARKEAELRERKSKEDIEAYRRELIERKKAEAAEREKKEGEEKRDE